MVQISRYKRFAAKLWYILISECNQSNAPLNSLKWTTVNSLYSGYYRDLELVSSLARVRNSGSLFQSNVCNLFLPGI